MILIADSGATSTDWCLLDENTGDVKYFTTQGTNPRLRSPVWISKMLLDELPVTVQKIALEELYFYGAGIASVKQAGSMEQTLRYIFNSRSFEVRNDLFGAVRAACGDEPGIACILGTGSNSVYYDGSDMIKKSHALGFILGDEGSGAFIGKQLVADFLYDTLPGPLTDHMRDEMGLQREAVLDGIYSDPNPNRYLASFSAILSDFRGIPYVEKLLKDCFSEFLKRHVLIYGESREHPVHFIGSIAYFYGDVIANLCEDHGLKLGKIIQRPVEDLKDYHLHKFNGQQG